MWTLYDTTGRIRSKLGAVEARDLVIIDANVHGVYTVDDAVDNRTNPPTPPTGEAIHWADVSSELWPEDHGYGPAPEDWPYGN